MGLFGGRRTAVGRVQNAPRRRLAVASVASPNGVLQRSNHTTKRSFAVSSSFGLKSFRVRRMLLLLLLLFLFLLLLLLLHVDIACEMFSFASVTRLLYRCSKLLKASSKRRADVTCKYLQGSFRAMSNQLNISPECRQRRRSKTTHDRQVYGTIPLGRSQHELQLHSLIAVHF